MGKHAALQHAAAFGVGSAPMGEHAALQHIAASVVGSAPVGEHAALLQHIAASGVGSAPVDCEHAAAAGPIMGEHALLQLHAAVPLAGGPMGGTCGSVAA
jgi:hypothetical protein